MSFVQPGRFDVHVNRPLTNIATAMIQDASNFIADQIFPNVPVQKQSDVWWNMPRGAFNRADMKERAPATESAGANFMVEVSDPYLARVYALHHDIHDQVRANADSALNLDRMTTLFLTTKAMLQRETSWINLYFKAGVWTFEFDGVASGATPFATLDPTSDANNNVLQWNDAASTPIEIIRKAKSFMLGRTGFMPNTLTLGRQVYDTLVDHPDIVGRIDRGQTPVGPARTTRENLATLFELDRVLVSDAIINSGKEGLADSHNFIAGKHALLSYTPANPGLWVPSAGYTFSWNGYFAAGPMGERMKRFRMEHLSADRVEIEMAYTQKVISPEMGFFFENIVA